MVLDVTGVSSDNDQLEEEQEEHALLLATKQQARRETSAIRPTTTDADDDRQFRKEAYILALAALIGILSGASVGVFKLSIDALRRYAYGPFMLNYPQFVQPLIPALGGVAVGFLSLYGPFPPGLRGTVEAVDRVAAQDRKIPRVRPFQFLRKTVAAVCTLGTGASLGPEGPSVEVGMSMSRICMVELPWSGAPESVESRTMRSRLLLACGAAAGVSAGFNAPIAGVFFALEIVQGAFRGLSTSDNTNDDVTIATATSGNISAILISSVLSALISKQLLGDHLVFDVKEYALPTPLLELPVYVLLGAVSGLVAFCFTQAATVSKQVFDGETGPEPLRQLAQQLPNPAKPVVGGLICGLVGLAFPQILFFGYETLNALVANQSLPISLLLSLLLVKIFTTAIAAGSGLVGGTFAPSLFLGGMVGACFHNVMTLVLVDATAVQVVLPGGPMLQLADVPAYAMVGAASVLAALFRAPLTASLLLFELTRDYEVILPLMASAGVGSLVSDLVEQKFERLKRRDEDAVSWGDLSNNNSGAVLPIITMDEELMDDDDDDASILVLAEGDEENEESSSDAS